MKQSIFVINFEYDSERDGIDIGFSVIPKTIDEKVLLLTMLKHLFDGIQEAIPEDIDYSPYRTTKELTDAILKQRQTNADNTPE